MSSPKVSPAPKPAKAPSLKQRAARARDGLLRLAPRPALPSPLPEPGSPEAQAAFGAACQAFDRATYLSDEQYEVLHIGDTGTLWTPERVRDAMKGDFSWFNPREIEGARAKTREELEDLLVLTLRRDLRFAEAERRSGFKVLAALAHPGAEDEPGPAPDGDQALVMIAAHRVAYAAWLPHLDATTHVKGGSPEYGAVHEAAEEPMEAEDTAYGNVITVRPTTLAGLRALAAYVPEAVRLNSCSEPDDDAVLALHTMCNGVLALVPAETEDTELLALGRDLDAAHAIWRGAEEAAQEPRSRRKTAEAAIQARPGHTVADLMGTYDLPGVNDTHSAAQAAFDALDPICAAIWRIPARTPLGLAVKARAALVHMFAGGNYEADAALGDDEDTEPENGRRLIEACCALAGVNWKGEPVGPAAPIVSPEIVMGPGRTELGTLTAAALDLSGVSIRHLARFYDHLQGLGHVASLACNAPMGWDDKRENHSPLGPILEAEADRLDGLAAKVAAEIRYRTPRGETERDDRLATLAKREMNLISGFEDKALLAELAAAWNG